MIWNIDRKRKTDRDVTGGRGYKVFNKILEQYVEELYLDWTKGLTLKSRSTPTIICFLNRHRSKELNKGMQYIEKHRI